MWDADYATGSTHTQWQYEWGLDDGVFPNYLNRTRINTGALSCTEIIEWDKWGSSRFTT